MIIEDESGKSYEVLLGSDGINPGFYAELRVLNTLDHVATVWLSENGNDYEIVAEEGRASAEFVARFVSDQKGMLRKWWEDWSEEFPELVPRRTL